MPRREVFRQQLRSGAARTSLRTFSASLSTQKEGNSFEDQRAKTRYESSWCIGRAEGVAWAFSGPRSPYLGPMFFVDADMHRLDDLGGPCVHRLSAHGFEKRKRRAFARVCVRRARRRRGGLPTCRIHPKRVRSVASRISQTRGCEGCGSGEGQWTAPTLGRAVAERRASVHRDDVSVKGHEIRQRS